MTTTLVTPSEELPVTVEEAKDNLGVIGTDDDAQIRMLIAGIVEETESYLGRSIINKTWRVTLDAFPDAIELANPPISSVSSVQYYDTDGVLQTLHPDDYYVDRVMLPGYVVPSVGKRWPSTQCRLNAVMVEYIAGYGETSASVPADIRAYISAKLKEEFDNEKPNPYLIRKINGKKVY
jgi:uncharacterized phiE125 gp8 family phage protein